MTKTITRYACQNCGRVTAAYVGRCPQCGEFGTMNEEVVTQSPPGLSGKRAPAGAAAVPERLRDVSTEDLSRLQLPSQEFCRVLGGGIVAGSLVLVGGDPGIGKSTLLLEIAAQMANLYGNTLYVSGEESVRQIKLRAQRMGLKAEDLFVVTETSLEAILGHIEELQPALVIVDSIQTTHREDVTSSAGSVAQVRECAARLQEAAKQAGVTIVLVGHVTKEGTIAGPKVLEHIVDTVLYLEGDPLHKFRLLRSAKNRFGATSEVAVFEMAEKGLIEVQNPSEAFLAERQVNASGSSIAVPMEGTRPILVEIQSLVSTTTFTNPRRTANGIDYNRLLMLVAVLSRRAGIRLHDKDVFVNVVGGLQIEEPAADLAVALAIASSARDRPVHADVAFIGEVGLSGELRAVGQLDLRIREASKLGFRRCVVPYSASSAGKQHAGMLQLVPCRTLLQAMEAGLMHERVSDAS